MTTQSVQPTPQTAPQVEPWLRGTYSDLPAVLRAILHAFDLAREDAVHWADGLTEAELHSSPSGLSPICFHLRHIARSLDRMLTYAEGNQLNAEQLTAARTELDPGISREELLAEFHQGLDRAAQRVRAFASADLEEPRSVGKKQLPTSVGGLLVHLADHTQRHTGQIVTTAKLLKAARVEVAPAGVHGLS
ncbi:MAG TPA: DinB family protein [Silvibacterium sp.]|nr:DinB family protein [Silvibacterium sp.]